MLPNAQGLVSAFLRTDDDVVALVGDRVYTTLPAGHDTWPAVRITRVGGRPSGPNGRTFDHPALQLDCWGGPKAVALQVAETIMDAIALRLPGRHDEGYVYPLTDNAFGPLRDLPDLTFDPARPRFIFDVTLMTRAARA